LPRWGANAVNGSSFAVKLRPSQAQSSAGLVPAHEPVVSFGIYLFGIVLVIAGMVYAAAIVHLPTQWIVVTALVTLGIGVVAAVKATRQRDPAE
jgi:hypothetical protein